MGPHGEEMETAAVITTEANKTLHPIHHRMPVVIPPDAFDFWLDPRVDALTAAALLVPAPENLFQAYPISMAVNRVTNDSPELLAPLAAHSESAAPPPPPAKPGKRPKDDRQPSLF
jgi:putative SOS response-associated peptidase YedK